MCHEQSPSMHLNSLIPGIYPGILRFSVRKKCGTFTVSVITRAPRVNRRIEEQSQDTGKSLGKVLTSSARTVPK
ncbi:hypothetical protein WN944_023146 [Citrus x changshan-huyou]|uniref:Uncharacterized protein n=1 Tax=Citrus x changshan-huyou TaxID=2935761 RepID=A0AAP0N5E5_9ROSI